MTGPYLRKLVREKVRENVLVLEYFSATKNAKVMRGNAPTATPQAELQCVQE